MNNLTKIALASALALSSVAANAEVITFGHLSTDAAFDVIADTERGREYLRLDSFDMTYAQTVAATSVGGIYESWSMADFNISDDFINAMFSQSGENTCSSGIESHGEFCGTLSNWTDGSFGAGYTSNNDYWAFLSHNSASPIGLVRIGATGNVHDYRTWSSISNLDGHSDASGYTINILLYRENAAHLGGFNSYAAENDIVGVTSVPVPATLGLLALAMAGLSFRRKSV